MTSALVYAALAGAIAVANVAYGRLRAPAPRRSHAWFGCLAAPVMLLIAVRKLFAFSWAGWAGLIAAAVIGQMIGRRLGARDASPSPARWRLAVYAAMTGAWLLLIGPPLHAADDPHAAHRAAAGTGYQRFEVNEPAPGFDLVDQRGQRRRLEDLRGSVVVLTFLYTSCTDVCPLLVHSLQQVERQLTDAEKTRVHFVGVTVDPKRDTPAQLRRFIAQRGLDQNRWQLLTGDIETVTKVTADYGVVVRPAPRGDFVHNSVFVVIDAQGVDRVEFHGVATSPKEIATAVRAAVPPPARQ